MNTIKDLQGLSEKIYLCLNKPEEEENVSDHLRLSRALEELGYQSIRFSLDAQKNLSAVQRSSVEGYSDTCPQKRRMLGNGCGKR